MSNIKNPSLSLAYGYPVPEWWHGVSIFVKRDDSKYTNHLLNVAAANSTCQWACPVLYSTNQIHYPIRNMNVTFSFESETDMKIFMFKI